MSGISTHVLDVAAGSPAAGIRVILEKRSGDHWRQVGSGVTNGDGRIESLLEGELDDRTYRLSFLTSKYHESQGLDAFFPEVTVTFEVRDSGSHHHVPVLLSPHGYTTYRGS
ncbi:MAG: hydroxyisourate hydrolase [Acidimicrobiia bacterium]